MSTGLIPPHHVKWNVPTHLLFVSWKRLQHHENRKCSSWFRKGASRSRGHSPADFHSRQRWEILNLLLKKFHLLQFSGSTTEFFVFFHFTHFKVIENAVSFQPCYCSAYVHVTCLQKWLQVSKTHTCEVCNFQFKAERRMKPISQVINHVLRMYLFPFVPECLTLL